MRDVGKDEVDVKRKKKGVTRGKDVVLLTLENVVILFCHCGEGQQ